MSISERKKEKEKEKKYRTIPFPNQAFFHGKAFAEGL
jgi:hypothetical protein